ncbi:MAG TPA: hypothetical protein VMG35_15515 [Bryobacteraceae bacterium]|nr:hypothetical protein [Bryobacteraceae bacterium]
MRKKWVFIAPLAILALLGFIALGGYIVQQLWNWLLPPLFAWREVTFWQALGLLALCRILFGGLGSPGSGKSGFPRRKDKRLAERWAAMTPEERERFRQGMRGSCGLGPSTGESAGDEAK